MMRDEWRRWKAETHSSNESREERKLINAEEQTT